MVSVGGSLPFAKAHHKYMVKVKIPFSSTGNSLCPQPGSLSKSPMGGFRIGLGGAPHPNLFHMLYLSDLCFDLPPLYIYIYI